MTVFHRMLSTQALMLVYILLGAIGSKIGWIRREGRPTLINLLIDITLPCMILHSFEREVSEAELLSAGQALLISAACCLVSYGIGLLLWRKQAPARRAVLVFATMFSNAGNAGLPIVALVFGDTGVFYTSFFLIPIRVLLWTLGLSLFVPGRGEQKWKALVLNPSLLIVFVGLAVMLIPIRLPSELSMAVANVGNMTGPLSMMIIGASLADMKPKDALDGGAWGLALVRLVAMPLLCYVVLRLLKVDDLLTCVATTLLAMPAATNTAIIAEKYGCDYLFAAKCVFVTTILSLATAPCVSLLF